MNNKVVKPPHGVKEEPGVISLPTQIWWVILWILNNMGLTMINKYAFSYTDFHYPLTVSAFHMACNWLGTSLYFLLRGVGRKQIKRQDYRTLLLFSAIFSLNIAIGNISASLVSVNFNQVLRALVPPLVMVVGTCGFRKKYSSARKLAVIPIVIGVAFSCYGDMQFSALGMQVTLLCVFLAAFKVVLSSEILTGEAKLPPVELLACMAPLALVQITSFAVFSGEALAAWDSRMALLEEKTSLYVVGLSGLASITLNLTSLQANKVTSPLTLSIIANVKQVMLMTSSTIIFKTRISNINFWGIVIVMLASTRYSIISVKDRVKETKEESPMVLPK
ncbi:unnamed protein product [Choristocarpus tenellus]